MSARHARDDVPPPGLRPDPTHDHLPPTTRRLVDAVAALHEAVTAWALTSAAPVEPPPCPGCADRRVTDGTTTAGRHRRVDLAGPAAVNGSGRPVR